ncbi:unnamed protein product [Candida verbasci]|uniref:Uncharacterized protein n=1 Tax=Candida verbasci TaxID=1227364 RepID=A0A9W4TZP7_9ASCO|nr:unnamed protein product [Candida verbasci]
MRSHGSPMSHKIIVGLIATFLGGYVTYKTGSDFEFVKFEPRREEEIEKLKKDGKNPFEVKFLDQVSLNLKPEAEARILKKMKEEQERKLALEKEQTNGN